MKIELTDKEYEFLKELKHELNTQENDGNADPVFWGVEETYTECRGGDGEYGGDPYIRFDFGVLSVEEAVEDIQDAFKNEPEEYNDDIRAEWKEVDKTCAEDICEFMIETLQWKNVYGVDYIEKVQRITPYTGAFLTKRACKEYIKKYGYNHCNPHTYAMTAYRNFELGNLITFLKNLKFVEE